MHSRAELIKEKLYSTKQNFSGSHASKPFRISMSTVLYSIRKSDNRLANSGVQDHSDAGRRRVCVAQQHELPHLVTLVVWTVHSRPAEPIFPALCCIY